MEGEAENERLTIEMANILFEARQARDQWERTARHENATCVAAEKVRDEAIKMRDIAIAEAKEERIISRQERTQAEDKREKAEKKREEAEKKREEAEKKRDAAMAREASAIKERDAAMAREASAIKERDAAMAREASAIENALTERQEWREERQRLLMERQGLSQERQRLLESALTERQGWSTERQRILMERQGLSQERKRLLESALTERQGWSTERHRLLDIISIGSAGFANLNDFSRPKIESAARKLKALTNGDTVKIESRGYFGSTILDKEDFVELKVFTGSQSNVKDAIASDMEERSSKIFTVLSPTVNPTTINDDLCQDWEAVLTKRGISEEVGISAMNVCI
jgi:hypothetical protein